MESRIEKARDAYRIASLSADPTNFLMWSHYADGHKGVVLEVEIPDELEQLTQVVYSPFSSVFTEKVQTKEDMRHLFNGKGEEWAYEQEYRLISDTTYFALPFGVSRLLLGPLVSNEQEIILRSILPTEFEITRMRLDRAQGTLTVNSADNSLRSSSPPSRFDEERRLA